MRFAAPKRILRLITPGHLVHFNGLSSISPNFSLGQVQRSSRDSIYRQVPNRKLAEMKARQIELDIVSGNFDPTWAKYKLHWGWQRCSLLLPPKLTPSWINGGSAIPSSKALVSHPTG
jgi:hypothetical protein